jgi:hypothetical protein
VHVDSWYQCWAATWFGGLESAVLALELINIDLELALIFENGFRIRPRFYILKYWTQNPIPSSIMCETETKFSVPGATSTGNWVWFPEVELELKPEIFFGRGRGGVWSKNQTWNQIFGSIIHVEPKLELKLS